MNNTRRLKKFASYFKKIDYARKVLGLLRLHGYWESIDLGMPVNFNRAPIPWYTYPATDFLSQFDYSEKTVFEWGCGNSSLFWSNRAKEVVSAEGDPDWFDKINKQKPKNLNITHINKRTDYVNFIKTQKRKFDIIVIDGEYRRDCAKIAVKYINSGGLIILDNSDWYRDIAKSFRNQGFIQIDFKGMGPLNTFNWVSSIFFKNHINFKNRKDRQPTSPLGHY